MDSLAACQGIYVKQQIELVEALTGCETKNKYKVHAWDPVRGAEDVDAGRLMPELFKAKEESECCERICCGPIRSFTMRIGHEANPADHLLLLRPFKCTCFCLARPLLRIVHPALGDLGEVYSPFVCCAYRFIVRAPTGVVTKPEGPPFRPAEMLAASGRDKGDWYIIEGSACQAGAWCSCPCGKCKYFNFTITDAQTGAEIGMLKRVFPGCVKSCVTDADIFVCRFPPDALPFQKAALLGAVFLVDFCIFEKQQNNNHG